MSVNQKIASFMKTLGLPSTPNIIIQFNNLLGSGGGCDDFTLTVEALAFVDPNAIGDGTGLTTIATNQEYFFKEEEGVVSLILPWVILPESSISESQILPSLNITTDRGCCQDAIQISLVGEDTQDLAEYVPLDFEVPEGESAIMIPLMFSSEASFGPKVIGVQAIGCGQDKIKDLYFEYINPNSGCPDSIGALVSVYNNFGTWYDLYIYSDTAGDYEVEFFINGISALTTTGYTNGNGERIQVSVSPLWDPSAYHYLDIRFTPYEFVDEENNCGDYCASYGTTGTFTRSLTLTPCPPEPYYGMAAIGEDVIVSYVPEAK
jgi:hypothetical protein